MRLKGRRGKDEYKVGREKKNAESGIYEGGRLSVRLKEMEREKEKDKNGTWEGGRKLSIKLKRSRKMLKLRHVKEKGG